MVGWGVVIGKGPNGEDIKIRVNEDGFLLCQLVILDTETTNEEVEATGDAQGRIYVSQAFTGDLTVTMGDVEKLLADAYWLNKQFDWTSGNCDYIGLNTSLTAADGDTDWQVAKLEYDGSDNCIKIRVRTMSWTGRASGWA